MQRGLFVIFLATATTLACGCNRGVGGVFRKNSDYIKPTIAVMKFENRSSLPLGWNVGGGMKDMLVDRLCATGRFQVIERPELDSVMGELNFQQTGATREQNRARLGRIKNVQYLVKGTVTDFGHVSTRSGFFRWADNLGIFGSGYWAVMGMTLYVVDVESGEIVCSESLEESVRAKDMNVKVAYRDVGFGGSTFLQTPLGRVTAKVIDKAVKRVAKSVAGRRWQPKIAKVVGPTTVVLNGGKDRGVSPGDEYDVVETGDAIVDPDTGDVLGTETGRVVGRLRVGEVHARYSVAEVVAGDAARMTVGQQCRPVNEKGPIPGAALADDPQAEAGPGP